MADKRTGFKAGLALHGDALRYIEVKEYKDRFRVLRAINIPLVRRTITRNSVVNFEMLGEAFKRLRTAARGFSVPVSIGIPTSDVYLKPLTFPRMNMNDAISSLKIQFAEHFGFPGDQAICSLSEITAPVGYVEEREMQCMAAAVKLTFMNQFQNTLRRARIPTHSIEPMGTALARMIGDAVGDREIYLFINIENDFLTIVVLFDDNGLVYRFTPLSVGEQRLSDYIKAVKETIDYIAMEYGDMTMSKILVASTTENKSEYKRAIQEMTRITPIDATLSRLWSIDAKKGVDLSGFETAFSLAIR